MWISRRSVWAVVGIGLCVGEEAEWSIWGQQRQLRNAFSDGNTSPLYYKRAESEAALSRLHCQGSLALLTGPQGCGKSTLCRNVAATDGNCCYALLQKQMDVHTALTVRLRILRTGWRGSFFNWRYWGSQPKVPSTTEIIEILEKFRSAQGQVPLLIIDDCNSLPEEEVAILGEFAKQAKDVVSVLLVFSPGDNLGKFMSTSAGARVSDEIRVPDLNEDETKEFFCKMTGGTEIPSNLYQATFGRVNEILKCTLKDPILVKQSKLGIYEAKWKTLSDEQRQITQRLLWSVITQGSAPSFGNEFLWLQRHNFIHCTSTNDRCAPDSPLVVEWLKHRNPV